MEAFIGHCLDQVKKSIEGISVREIKDAIGLLLEVRKAGGKVFIMGNGGSASTASHFACDLAKWPNVGDSPRFKVMSLSDNLPLITGLINDCGFSSIFVEQLKAWLEPRDRLVGISVHGGVGEGDAGPWSPNFLEALKLAKARGASILGISGYDGGALKRMADVCILVPVGDSQIGIPLVEGLHVVLHHLICATLRELNIRSQR